MNALNSPHPAPMRVAVVAFNGISAFHLSIPGVVFGEAPAAPKPFEVTYCAVEPLHDGQIGLGRYKDAEPAGDVERVT